MKELFQIYARSLFRPFATQESLRVLRLSTHNQSIFAFQKVSSPTGGALSFLDAMSISWVMVLIKAIYAMVALLIGVYWLGILGDEGRFISGLKFWGTTAQTITIFMIIFEVILFPLTLWFYTKFWGVVIRFFGELFEVEGDMNQISEQIVNHSLSSHLFLIIPVFGEMVKHLAGLTLIYAGLKNNMRLNTMQSLMVLLSPLILLLFIMFLSALYLVLMLSFV